MLKQKFGDHFFYYYLKISFVILEYQGQFKNYFAKNGPVLYILNAQVLAGLF